MHADSQKEIAGITAPLATNLQAVAAQVDTTPDMLPIDVRIAQAFDVLSGRTNYLATAANYPGMRNEQLRQALLQVQAQVQTISDALASQSATFAARLAVNEVNLAANHAADEAEALHWNVVDARSLATASKLAAAELRLAELAARQAADEASQALLAGRVSADEATLSLLQQALAAAQATATTATAKAEAAQAKADQDAVQAAAALAAANTAISLAQAAQASATAANNRFRGKLVATPSVTLAAGTAKTLAVLWDSAFPDASYEIGLTPGPGLTGVRATYADKTAAGFSLILTNIGALSLLVPAGVVDATGQR